MTPEERLVKDAIVVSLVGGLALAMLSMAQMATEAFS